MDRSQGSYTTLLAAWAREARGTEAVGTLAGAPMQTGLLELAGVFRMLAEVSCGPGPGRVVVGCSCHQLPWALPSPLPGPGKPHTFEAILTQALDLILASRHACGTVLAGLALTRGAVVALPNVSAAQEAVGEVQPLSIH